MITVHAWLGKIYKEGSATSLAGHLAIETSDRQVDWTEVDGDNRLKQSLILYQKANSGLYISVWGAHECGKCSKKVTHLHTHERDLEVARKLPADAYKTYQLRLNSTRINTVFAAMLKSGFHRRSSLQTIETLLNAGGLSGFVIPDWWWFNRWNITAGVISTGCYAAYMAGIAQVALSGEPSSVIDDRVTQHYHYYNSMRTHWASSAGNPSTMQAQAKILVLSGTHAKETAAIVNTTCAIDQKLESFPDFPLGSVETLTKRALKDGHNAWKTSVSTVAALAGINFLYFRMTTTASDLIAQVEEAQQTQKKVEEEEKRRIRREAKRDMTERDKSIIFADYSEMRYKYVAYAVLTGSFLMITKLASQAIQRLHAS